MRRYIFFIFVAFSSYLLAHEIHIGDHKWSNTQCETEQEIAQFIFEKFKFNGKENVLDLRCGMGEKAAQLSRLIRSGKILGIDSSSALIQSAQKNFPAKLYNNLSFIEGDPNEFQHEKYFDVIFSLMTFPNEPQDPQIALTNIHHLLKTNGTVALSIPLALPLTLQEALEELLSQKQWRSIPLNLDFHFKSLDFYKALLKQTGFEINLFEKKIQKNLFETRESLMHWISSWLAHQLPPSFKLPTEFVRQWIERYCVLEGIEDDRSLYLSTTYLIVIAHKK